MRCPTTLLVSLAIGCLSAPGIAVPDTYSVISRNGSWSFRSPNGQDLWSFGVCCTEPEWGKYDAAKPGYDARRLFATRQEWVKDTESKFKDWGFNSLGGWSADELFTRYGGAGRPPYFLVLHLGSYDKAPWHDLFSADMEKAVDGAAKAQIPEVASDPKLVGYFSDNELGWWGDTLFETYLALPPEAPGSRVLMALLRLHYGVDFKVLTSDWATPSH
jgi:hypothetical protein